MAGGSFTSPAKSDGSKKKNVTLFCIGYIHLYITLTHKDSIVNTHTHTHTHTHTVQRCNKMSSVKRTEKIRRKKSKSEYKHTQKKKYHNKP